VVPRSEPATVARSAWFPFCPSVNTIPEPGSATCDPYSTNLGKNRLVPAQGHDSCDQRCGPLMARHLGQGGLTMRLFLLLLALGAILSVGEGNRGRGAAPPSMARVDVWLGSSVDKVKGFTFPRVGE